MSKLNGPLKWHEGSQYTTTVYLVDVDNKVLDTVSLERISGLWHLASNKSYYITKQSAQAAAVLNSVKD